VISRDDGPPRSCTPVDIREPFRAVASVPFRRLDHNLFAVVDALEEGGLRVPRISSARCEHTCPRNGRRKTQAHLQLPIQQPLRMAFGLPSHCRKSRQPRTDSWIWDRGHPPANTEIHPPRLVAIRRDLPIVHGPAQFLAPFKTTKPKTGAKPSYL